MKRPFLWILAAALAYAVLSYLVFEVPATLADAQACGFVASDFGADGRLAHPPLDAWWISFVRKQEYWTALSLGMAIAFVAHALKIGRAAGAARVTGAAAGGGLLALSALCVSCLAPVLSAVGLGLAGSWLVGVPKWLIALNTALLTGWGGLLLSRRSAACPLPTLLIALAASLAATTPDTSGAADAPAQAAAPTQAAPAVSASKDYRALLLQARPDLPLAHPLATQDLPPPPFSLLSDRPVKPAYVPTLPGLRSGVAGTDDFGRKPPKFDAVFIRKSRIENGEVVIPPGGLAYLEDTWGGEVALRGEMVPVLGKTSTYVDYDMSITVKENVTIPAGQSVVVGGQVYHYYATVGHGQTANHTLHVRTIAGTDWEWAFGAPVLSPTQTQWWGGMKFAQLYNQGQAREVTREKMVFDWISGVRMDRLVLADEKLFSGAAGAGDSWKAGARTVRVAAIDAKAGTVTVEVLDGDKVVLSKVLGPVKPALLIEDTEARKSLVFEHGDIVGFLSPWPEPFKDGKANLKLYAKAYSLSYGTDFAADPRFAVYPVACPTGHNFGFMLVNKTEIRLKPGAVVDGPQGYFKVAVDKIEGDQVLAWHVQDGQGNRSHNLGGVGVNNVDLVLGQGRVAGQAILKDVGKALLERTYALAAPAPEAPATLTPGLLVGLGVAGLALFALAFELGRRRPRAS